MAGPPWKPVERVWGKRGQYGGKQTLFLRLAHTADLYSDYGAGVCASGELRKPVHKTGDRGSGIYQERICAGQHHCSPDDAFMSPFIGKIMSKPYMHKALVVCMIGNCLAYYCYSFASTLPQFYVTAACIGFLNAAPL